MPKPPAEFILHSLYNGEVQIKEFVKSHGYKVFDKKNGREWEKSPSATGLTGAMDKGAGLMMYAMSEAMKFMDRQFQNISVKKAIEDESFTFTDLFKKARQAHLDKSALGQRVGTASHTYVENLLSSMKQSQDQKTQWVVPPSPRAIDLASDLTESYQQIVGFFKLNKLADAERLRGVLDRDIDVRTRLWNESLMVQNTCEEAREFFVQAVREGALRVWGVEQLVHSRKFFFSGRFDSILEFVKPFTWRGYTIDTGVFITDFKTSNPSRDYPMGVYPNYLPQTGLYDVAYCEEHPEIKDRITGHLILGSSKIGSGFHPYVSKDRERNRQWGIALVPVMEFMHQGDKELRGLDLYGGENGKI